MVGRSDVDVHTYESIHNPINGDRLEWIFFYILSYPYGNPSFKGVPDNI